MCINNIRLIENITSFIPFFSYFLSTLLYKNLIFSSLYFIEGFQFQIVMNAIIV